ncbi:MAG: hypothetical protein JWN44_5468 [Myxococcales bacterium]|nr:hypothetical protein [Myxococcales bacterium]
MITEKALERRLRLAASLVMAGLVVELGSFFWHHPTAFIVFFVVGGLFFAAGILSYLLLILAKGG